VWKPEGRTSLGRPRRRWLDDVRMDLVEVRWGDVDWISLAQPHCHNSGHSPSSYLLFKSSVRTSQETHNVLSVGLLVPQRKHIMSCL
jgi:hypothetical protein